MLYHHYMKTRIYLSFFLLALSSCSLFQQDNKLPSTLQSKVDYMEENEDVLLPKAMAGDVDALGTLGFYYYVSSLQPDRNALEASNRKKLGINLLEQAAEKGDTGSILRLVDYYKPRIMQAQPNFKVLAYWDIPIGDEKKYLHYVNQLIKSKDKQDQAWGYAELGNWNLLKKPKTAFSNFKKSYQASKAEGAPSISEGHVGLALSYIMGTGCKKNVSKAEQIAEELLAIDNPYFQSQGCYVMSKIHEDDPKAHKQWTKKRDDLLDKFLGE